MPRVAEVERTAHDLAEAFHADGAVCLRGLFTADQILELERGIERNLREPSALAMVASRPEDPGWFFEDFRNWDRIDEYRAIIFDSPLGAVASQLMRSAAVRLFHDHLLVKEPGTRQRTPWHQDQPYYNVDGTQTLSMWLPVDPVPRESTLEFVAGSHRGPWLMPRTFLEGEAKWFREGTLSELPDIEADRSAFRILGWELEPGDAVFFSMLTLHAASGVGGQLGDGPSRCVCSATTSPTHRARGAPRRPFRASRTSCRLDPRWTTLSFRNCGPTRSLEMQAGVAVRA